MTNRILTFELSADGDQLDIHGDTAGLQDLLQKLQGVIRSHKHEHLMTLSWGGDELTEEAQGKDARLINKVTIHIW
jgi:hypothetical protein